MRKTYVLMFNYTGNIYSSFPNVINIVRPFTICKLKRENVSFHI